MTILRFKQVWQEEAEAYFVKNYHPDAKLKSIDEVPPYQIKLLHDIFERVAASLPEDVTVQNAAESREALEGKLMQFPEELDSYTTPIYSGLKSAIKKLSTLENA